MNTIKDTSVEREPEAIEALLPWHAAGTLNARDAARVEDALKRDPALARQYEAVREELAETIHLNESLGAPSSRALDEAPVRGDRCGAGAHAARFASLCRNGSRNSSEGFRRARWPMLRAAAALAIMLQAGVIGAILVKASRGRHLPVGLVP